MLMKICLTTSTMATCEKKSSISSEEDTLKNCASHALIASDAPTTTEGGVSAASTPALDPFAKKTSCWKSADARTSDHTLPSDGSTLLATGSPADLAHWLWHGCPRFGGDAGLVKRFLQSALESLPGTGHNNHSLNETDRDAAIRWLGGVLLSGTNSLLKIGSLSPRGKFLLRFCQKGIELVSCGAPSASQTATTTCAQVLLHAAWVETIVVFPQPQDYKQVKSSHQKKSSSKKTITVPSRTVLIVLRTSAKSRRLLENNRKKSNRCDRDIADDTSEKEIPSCTFRNKQLMQLCWKWPAPQGAAAAAKTVRADDKSHENSATTKISSEEDNWLQHLQKSLHIDSVVQVTYPSFSALDHHSSPNSQPSYQFMSFHDGQTSSTTSGLPFVSACSGVDAGFLYPISSGILFWKPAQWIPADRMKQLSLAVVGAGGRYVTLTVVLERVEKNNVEDSNSSSSSKIDFSERSRARKGSETDTDEASEKMKDMIIEFTNIQRQELTVLQEYIQHVVDKRLQEEKINPSQGDDDTADDNGKKPRAQGGDPQDVAQAHPSGSRSHRTSSRHSDNALKLVRAQARAVDDDDDDDDEDYEVASHADDDDDDEDYEVAAHADYDSNSSDDQDDDDDKKDDESSTNGNYDDVAPNKRQRND